MGTTAKRNEHFPKTKKIKYHFKIQRHDGTMERLLPTFSYSFTLQTERASSPGHMIYTLHEVLNYTESVELWQGL